MMFGVAAVCVFIQLSGSNPSKEIQVTTRDFQVMEGRAGFGVQVGERVLGFAAERVSSVSLRVAEGRLHVQLQNEAGAAVREIQVPSTDVLRKDLRALTDAGVYFSPKEVGELDKLLRLSMAGTVSREEVLLMLDEISHLAPSVDGAGRLDAGDLYPDLANQVRELMTVMPDDIQRFVVLNNIDRFGEDLWRTFHAISKMDPQQHPALARFLAGDGPMNYLAEAELQAVLQENPLVQGGSVTRIDPNAFQELMGLLAGKEIAGDYRTIHFPQPLARLIFEHFSLEIPDFSKAPDFETLEAQFMTQLKASHPLPGRAEDPLKKQLFAFLDTQVYRELADFLVGKAKPGFTTEVQESFAHFLRNPPEGVPERRLSSIADSSYERLMRLVRSKHMDVPGLLQGFPRLADQEDTADPIHLNQLGRAFRKLDRAEQLALFVMDHLDPHAHRDLFSYFDGGQAGLTKMTSSLRGDLQAFLAQKRIPEVREGLNQFSPLRFEELAEVLDGFPELGAPQGFLPTNPRLRRALMAMGGEAAPESAAGLEENRPPVRTRTAGQDLASELWDKIKGLQGQERNERLTGLLKQHLPHFREVAMLDQTWRAQRLVGEVQSGRGDTVGNARQLVSTLGQVAALLGGEEATPNWEVWGRPKLAATDPPSRNTLQRLLQQEEGLQRYLQLDQQLTSKPGAFQERVEELSWMRRLQELGERVEKNLHTPSKLGAALEKLEQTLEQLSKSLLQGEKGVWSFHRDSPWHPEKQNQFLAFRDSVLQGSPANPDKLFEGPFLRQEFAPSAERLQENEMKRLEPFFKEAVRRFETEPAKVLERVMEHLVRPSEGARPDVVGSKVQQLMDNLHDFNQHQNLNQQPMYLSLPLKLGEEQSEMELAYFRLPNAGRKKRFLVVIHLDFDTWGHLRVDALKEEQGLSATFWVGTAKMQQHLQRDLPTLVASLREKGLHDVGLEVRLEPDRAERPVSELCVPRRDGEVDVEI